MKRFTPLLAALAIFTLAGCSNLTQQEQQALSGGAIGAAGGAVFGALAGSPALGAALGGAVGTAAGAMWKDISDRTSGS